MNEQQLADLFSEQIDRMFENEALAALAEIDDLQELLNLGNQISTTQFQASPAVQAVFQSQLAGWFGLANGGSPMVILGLSKVWFISIIVAVVIGFGALVVVVTNIFGFNGDVIVEVPTVTATEEGAETPSAEETLTPETSTTPDPAETPTGEETPEAAPTDEAPTDEVPTDEETPTLIFIGGGLGGVTLCQGSYGTQATLVNYGNLPVTNAGLVWEVIEGAELVDNMNIVSPVLISDDTTPVVDTDAVALPDSQAMAVDIADVPYLGSHAFFDSSISVEQEVKLDVKVKVKDNWWQQESGTKIKVKLSVTNNIEIDNSDDYQDHDRGHGNDPDGFDEDNPGRGRGHHHPSQIITIVKQDAQWINLGGIAQPHGDNSWLVDGVVVTTNECTGWPLNFIPGANVQVIGFLQPDGTFVAINIIIVDVNVTVINFDSGVPMPSSDDGGGDGNGGGGGGKKGGSKKGGSKKGGS